MSATASLLLLLDPLGVRISFLRKSTLHRRHYRQGEGKALRGGHKRFNDVVRVSQRQDRGASRVPPKLFRRFALDSEAKLEERALAEAVSVTDHGSLTKSDPVVLLKLPASLCSGSTRSRGDRRVHNTGYESRPQLRKTPPDLRIKTLDCEHTFNSQRPAQCVHRRCNEVLLIGCDVSALAMFLSLNQSDSQESWSWAR